MAVKTIQIADKPTLDAAKALLEDSEVGLAAIKQAASSGAVSGSAGGLQIEKYVDEQVNGCVSVSTLPYYFHNGSAVVLNNEIHILGSSDDSTYTKHYKYNGTSWESVSTLPYYFYEGSAVVLNNEIHILGSGYSNSSGTHSYAKYHYKYDGTSWKSVSTLPYTFYRGSAVVLNNEIHIIGGTIGPGYDTTRKHYKFNGSSWTEVATLSYDVCNSSAVVLNNEIHILGSGDIYTGTYSYAKYHYKYDGTSWESVSTLPYNFYNGSAVVLNNEIHILGSYDSSNHTKHYKFNGSSWVNVSTLPFEFRNGFAVVLNGEIHEAYGSKHYIVRPDNRHITTLLPEGAHILLPQNETTIFTTDNANAEAPNIIKMTESGIVEILAELPDLDDVESYLTFY